MAYREHMAHPWVCAAIALMLGAFLLPIGGVVGWLETRKRR